MNRLSFSIQVKHMSNNLSIQLSCLCGSVSKCIGDGIAYKLVVCKVNAADKHRMPNAMGLDPADIDVQIMIGNKPP